MLSMTNGCMHSKLQAQLASKENDHRKQIAQLQTQQTAKDSEHQKQLVQVRKGAEAEAERVQRRKDAEMADLRATISRLEVDVLKVLSPLHVWMTLAYAHSHSGTEKQNSRTARVARTEHS